MQDNILFILQGLGLTVKLYIVTMVFSLPLGVILSLGRISKNSLLNNGIQIYTSIQRIIVIIEELLYYYNYSLYTMDYL